MRFVVFAVLVALVVPVFAQTAPVSSDVTLADVMAGKIYPLSMIVKDMDSSWRQFRVETVQNDATAGYVRIMMALMCGMDTSYFTKGNTITIGSETYLVAYMRKSKSIDPELLNRSDMPNPEPLTADTTLHLSLINLKTAGSLNEISVVNVQEMPAMAEEAKEQNSKKSLENLKTINTALLSYVDARDKFPAMKDARTLSRTLMPYMSGHYDAFTQPGTNDLYVPNAVLSEHKLAHITTRPSQMITFYEANEREDGSRAAAFLDGHAELLSRSEWEQYKKISKIP